MKESDKKTLWSFFLELLKLIFAIGQKHVEDKLADNK